MVTYSTFIVIAIYLILTILISWFVNQRSIGNTDFQLVEDSLGGLPQAFLF